MLTFGRLLFPVDFSECCTQASPYVAGIARKFNSHVTLLHAFDAYDAFGYGAASGTIAYGVSEDSIRHQRESALAQFGDHVFEGLNVTRVFDFGDPAEMVTRYAREHQVGLIAMPTHGRGTFRSLLLGSVTSKVLHDAACPIWTTAHSETLAVASAEHMRTLLCAIDLYSETVRVIRAASEMAVTYGAVVRLVHAIGVPEAKAGSNMDESLKRFLFDTASEQIAAIQLEAGTHYEVCLRAGSISTVVAETAMKCHADLVIIGRSRPQQFLGRLLGRLRTNVGPIIRQSPCPVLSV